MPYYRGDYYRGDNYYRGDGFFGKLIKGAGKLIGKVAGTALAVSPVGTVVRTFAPTRPQIAPFGPGTGMSVPEPGITGTVHRIAPGGHPGYGRYKKDGTWTERRAPRMDVGNMKALRRANRRAHGFLRVYKRAVSYFVAKSPKGKAYVHFKKRAK
jgi:hypothetical protein